MAHDHFYGICENKCLVEIEHDNIPGVVPVEKGGTGATSAADALSNLGAAAASHNHSAANITSGTLAIARGGTGATSASNARSNLGVTGTVLYNNTSGTNGTVTLSDSVANYDYLVIYFKNSNGNRCSIKIHSPNGQLAMLETPEIVTDGWYGRSCTATISGKSIVLSEQIQVIVSSSVYWQTWAEAIRVLRVEGWKI